MFVQPLPLLTRVPSSKLKEENIRIRAARASGREETLDVAMQENTVDDDEGSIVTELKKGHNSCGACRTRESETWWKAPKGLPTNVLCDHCGLSWRKYADLNVRPIREEPVPKAKPGDKREGTPLNGPTTKRAKVSVDAPDPCLHKVVAAHHVAPFTQTASSQSTPPPPPAAPAVPQLRCVACQRNGPVGKVLRCKQCQFRVHAGACGATPDPATSDSWVCDLCYNEKNLEASLVRILPPSFLLPSAPRSYPVMTCRSRGVA